MYDLLKNDVVYGMYLHICCIFGCLCIMAQHVYIIFSKFKSIFFVLVFVQAAYRVACFLVHQHLYLVEKEYFDLILVLIQSCFGV